MSFDDDEKRFGDNGPDDEDFYKLDDEGDESRGNEKKDDSVDDFFKDEDFEFETYDEGEDEKEPESIGLRSRRTKQRKKKRKAILKISAILIVLVLVAVGIVFWVVPWVKNRFFSKPEIAEEERITIPDSLLLGNDINIVIACAGGNLLEPDVNTVVFSSYYISENKLISLYIPPRTLMDIPGVGAEMIGRSVNIQGMDLLKLSLKKDLGMNIDVDYHILFDVPGVVDKLGGIELELEKEISVKNYSDNSTFTLEEGNNLIDGEEALNFLRYFSGIEKDVPVENIKNQKLIIDALIEKIAGKDDEEMSANLNSIKDFMETDLSMEDRLKIFSTFASIEADKNYAYSLDVSSNMDGEDIFYVPKDISKLAEIFSKEGTSPAEEVTDFTETVKITVLNGTYDSPEAFGLAGTTSETLKELKFEDGRNKYDVIEVGNSDNIYESTQILVYAPDANKLAAADDIKKVLGTGNVNPREDDVTSSDIIVILGKDYLAITTGTAETEEEEEEGQLIKIIVLNGEGTTGLAATVTGILDDYFNSEGETVVMLEPKSAANYNYTETEITVYTSGEGVNEVAQKIQERLGVGAIEYSDDNADNVDISIIIGSDYTK
jgi:polyisoprenyl-teichoic acid--peptidoglycan teichoic acid transferase